MAEAAQEQVLPPRPIVSKGACNMRKRTRGERNVTALCVVVAGLVALAGTALVLGFSPERQLRREIAEELRTHFVKKGARPFRKVNVISARPFGPQNLHSEEYSLFEPHLLECFVKEHEAAPQYVPTMYSLCEAVFLREGQHAQTDLQMVGTSKPTQNAGGEQGR